MSELCTAAELPHKATTFRKSNPLVPHTCPIDFISISTPNPIELIFCVLLHQIPLPLVCLPVRVGKFLPVTGKNRFFPQKKTVPAKIVFATGKN